MADCKRQNTRYHSSYRSHNNYSSNINMNVRDYAMDSDCNCNRTQQIENVSLQWEEQNSLGMAYVPMQQFKNLYEMECGLSHGTIFSQIDFPFEVGFCAGGCHCQ